MLDDLSYPNLWPLRGPMVVVFPELAINGSLERVAEQSTVFSNWDGHVCFLGGDTRVLSPDRPWQADYLNALEAMVAAGAGRYPCGTRKAGLIDATRALARCHGFRKAAIRKGQPSVVTITGAIAEVHIAIVSETLRDCGFFAVRSATAVACREIRRSRFSRLNA